MTRLGFGTAVLLVLAACNEEDDAAATETETNPAVDSESATATEDAGPARDGDGAADDAVAAETATATAGTTSGITPVAIDSCIEGLWAMDWAAGGTVVGTVYSEASSLVMLDDASGTTRRCIISNDGTVPALEVQKAPATADGGDGAMDGATSQGQHAAGRQPNGRYGLRWRARPASRRRPSGAGLRFRTQQGPDHVLAQPRHGCLRPDRVLGQCLLRDGNAALGRALVRPRALAAPLLAPAACGARGWDVKQVRIRTPE